METLTCRAVAAVLTAFTLLGGTGCAAHPEGFQEPCDLAAEALQAWDDGGGDGVKAALEDARLWVDAAYEDTEGSERVAAEEFYEAVRRALSDVKSEAGPTDSGRQALVDALTACS